MFDKLLEILKDLLPTKDLPTTAWVIRLTSLTSLAFVLALVVNSSLQNTPLGDRMGISKPIPTLPTLSQTSLIYGYRESWLELAKLHQENPNEIQSIFLTFIARKKDGNIVTEATQADLRVYPLIWLWFISSTRKQISLRLAEESFSPVLEKYRTIFKEKSGQGRYCQFAPINSTSLAILKRAIVGFDNNYVTFCALYDAKDVPIGAIIAYLKIPEDLTVDLRDAQLYYLMDRLRNVTDTLEPKFDNMSIPYQFMYNSRP